MKKWMHLVLTLLVITSACCAIFIGWLAWPSVDGPTCFAKICMADTHGGAAVSFWGHTFRLHTVLGSLVVLFLASLCLKFRVLLPQSDQASGKRLPTS